MSDRGKRHSKKYAAIRATFKDKRWEHAISRDFVDL